jgi:hypothetical protein
VYTFCNVRKYVSGRLLCDANGTSDLAMVSNDGPSSCGTSFPCFLLRMFDPSWVPLPIHVGAIMMVAVFRAPVQ